MPTLTINGKRVTVDDSFLALSPEQQDATVDEIAASMGETGGQVSEQQAAGELGGIFNRELGAEYDPADIQRGVTLGQYDRLPMWKKPLVATTDLADIASQAFGFRDKAVAAARAPFTDKSYDQELVEQRRQSRAARDRAGTAGIMADLVMPMGMAAKGVTLAGRAGTAGMTGAKGLAARSGLMAAEGAGYGALTAAGNDQDITTGAAMGAAAGAAGNVLGEGIAKGVRAVAGRFNPKQTTPTSRDWKAKADDAFTQMREEGVTYTPAALDNLESRLNSYLTKRGYWKDNQPGIAGGLALIKDYKDRGGLMTPDGLMALRERFSGGYIMGNKNNNAMVREAINIIDDLLKNPKKGFLYAEGDPARAARAYRDGMFASRTQHKLEDIEYLIAKGGRQGDRNISDNGAARIKTLLSDKLLDERSPMARGWNPAEREAIKRAGSWTRGERVAHATSGMLPKGALGGLVHGVTAAGTGGLSLVFQVPAMIAGYGAKRTAIHLANRSVNDLARLIANGGDASTMEVVENAIQLLSRKKRQALSRALMAAGVSVGAHGPGRPQNP